VRPAVRARPLDVDTASTNGPGAAQLGHLGVAEPRLPRLLEQLSASPLVLCVYRILAGRSNAYNLNIACPAKEAFPKAFEVPVEPSQPRSRRSRPLRQRCGRTWKWPTSVLIIKRAKKRASIPYRLRTAAFL
jgi:hypothetical protein